MILNRRGVSEVVANVLIVLLVIVSIAVVWSVVKPTIDKGTKGIQSDCFTINVEPISCSSDVSGWNVKLKRNPGAGNFESVELVFEDASGNIERYSPSPSIASTGAGSFDELETTSVSVGGLTINASKVNIVLKSNGQLCQITTQPVSCA
jgi:hypothetical protein